MTTTNETKKAKEADKMEEEFGRALGESAEVSLSERGEQKQKGKIKRMKWRWQSECLVQRACGGRRGSAEKQGRSPDGNGFRRSCARDCQEQELETVSKERAKT